MVKKLILVVDDEIGILKFLRANLEDHGYDAVIAMDGAEAIAAFEMNLPNLVILDITMPKMDGFEVCRRIRGMPPQRIPLPMLELKIV